MRVIPIAFGCIAIALGSVAAHGQTSSPGGSPSTGPAAGISPGRATGLSPEARVSPQVQGLPSNPGLSGEAGGMPFPDRTRPNSPGSMRDSLDRTESADPTRSDMPGLRLRERMRPGESTDRFPASRALPLRPGSPADARRDRMRPLGLEAEGSLSAAQRREAGRRTGADFSQRECENIYDSGTGMNRQQWSDSCRRVGQRMNTLQEMGTQQRQNPRLGPSNQVGRSNR